MKKICIIGGCGHVGIPLGLAFASKKQDVTLVDAAKEEHLALAACKLPLEHLREISAYGVIQKLYLKNTPNK